MTQGTILFAMTVALGLVTAGMAWVSGVGASRSPTRWLGDPSKHDGDRGRTLSH